MSTTPVTIQHDADPQHVKDAVAADGCADGAADKDDHRDASPRDAREASLQDSQRSGQDDEDDSEEESETEERLGLLARIKQRVQARQQQWLDARRDPVQEWKEEERWQREHAVYVAQWQAEREREEQQAAEIAAEKERKRRRRAQRRANEQRDREFRETLFQYEQDVIKSEKKGSLVTKFSIEDRANEKARLAEEQRRQQLAETAARNASIKAAIEHDREAQRSDVAFVQSQIGIADEIGRKYGLLPAINTPPAVPPADQDEVSTVVILRVNTANKQQSHTEEDPLLMPSSHAKPMFFTVNLKRFKHVEEIRAEAIGDKGGVELARSLLTGACPRVKRMHLGWCLLKCPAIAAMTDSFIRGACGQLQLLDLRCNGVDAKSVGLLLGALDQGGLLELTELVLLGNQIGDEGAKLLAHALLRGTLKGLHTIDIRQNRIRNAGTLAIWNVFTSESFRRYCPKLKLLDMRRNEAHGSLTRTFCPCPTYLEF
ncbi:hypothetical protein PINS_up021756 [Pythium insidiosum]|nr:hypothetical protein PINS_up021756 [Pythium insidiosum]